MTVHPFYHNQRLTRQKRFVRCSLQAKRITGTFIGGAFLFQRPVAARARLLMNIVTPWHLLQLS